MKKVLIVFLTVATFFGCQKSADTAATPTTGEGTFWVASDLGHGNITVTCNGTTQTITSYYPTKPSCGSNGCASFTCSPGTYPFTAVSADGVLKWSGYSITVTAGGCFTEQLTNNGGATTGTVMFWMNENGTTNVSVDGVSQGSITEYYPSNASSNPPGCGSAGCVSVTLTTGTHTYSATDGVHNWSGNVTVASGCNPFLLYY